MDVESKIALGRHGFDVRTRDEVAAEAGVVEVHSARVLSYLYSFLGRSEKLGLTGRVSRDVGVLSTSKIYKVHGRLFAFTPQVSDLAQLDNFGDPFMT
jgi:phosphorylase kinase alpha/beta subunit